MSKFHLRIGPNVQLEPEEDETVRFAIREPLRAIAVHLRVDCRDPRVKDV